MTEEVKQEIRDIRKIKMGKDSTTEVHYSSSNKKGSKETIYRGSETPDPKFSNDFQALIPHINQVFELPHKYLEDHQAIVIGMSISENDTQGLGAVITLLVYYEGINSPLVINTPHMHDDAAGSGNSQMPFEMMQLVRRCMVHANAFVDGARAQKDMFDDKPAPAPKKKAAAPQVEDDPFKQLEHA